MSIQNRPYQFDDVGCVFRGDCVKYGTPECKNPCWRQREWYWLLTNSYLPKKLQVDEKLIPTPQDLKVFEYLDYIRDNILEFVQSGSNLLIQGSTGNGKTTWVGKLIRAYLMRVSISNGFRPRAIFLNIPWYLSETRHSISDNQTSLKEMRKNCSTIDLLAIDDIGASSLDNNFIHDEIYSIINQRVDNGLSTIYTTNLSSKELEDNLGARLCGRVLGSSEVVKITSTVDLRRPHSGFSFKEFSEGR